jgi:hypothetical protein
MSRATIIGPERDSRVLTGYRESSFRRSLIGRFKSRLTHSPPPGLPWRPASAVRAAYVPGASAAVPKQGAYGKVRMTLDCLWAIHEAQLANSARVEVIVVDDKGEVVHGV